MTCEDTHPLRPFGCKDDKRNGVWCLPTRWRAPSPEESVDLGWALIRATAVRQIGGTVAPPTHTLGRGRVTVKVAPWPGRIAPQPLGLDWVESGTGVVNCQFRVGAIRLSRRGHRVPQVHARNALSSSWPMISAIRFGSAIAVTGRQIGAWSRRLRRQSRAGSWQARRLPEPWPGRRRLLRRRPRYLGPSCLGCCHSSPTRRFPLRGSDVSWIRRRPAYQPIRATQPQQPAPPGSRFCGCSRWPAHVVVGGCAGNLLKLLGYS